jgi:RHS repeat-associated protein
MIAPMCCLILTPTGRWRRLICAGLVVTITWGTNDSTGVSYYLSDHLGSTAGVTDASGNLVETGSYDSFGNSAGSGLTRYGYTGRERDPDTGIMYYRARWYDPQLGRFVSEDPIGFRGRDVNLYGYVKNSPLSYRDPSGLQRCDPILGALVGAGAGGTIGIIGGALFGPTVGATIGALVGGGGGTLVEPGGGTILGGGGGAAFGAAGGAVAGPFVGGALGAGIGAYIGYRICSGESTCDSEPQAPSTPFPTPRPTPLIPPFTPNNLDKDDECYQKCKHLLGWPGDVGNRYRTCYRKCKGTL